HGQLEGYAGRSGCVRPGQLHAPARLPRQGLERDPDRGGTLGLSATRHRRSPGWPEWRRVQLLALQPASRSQRQLKRSPRILRELRRGLPRARLPGAHLRRAGRFLERYLHYAYTRATFRNPVELATPIAPGTEVVPAGNTFALVPKHRLNFGLAYHPWPWATLSLGVVRVSSQFLRGDEANTQAPLPAYWVANAGLSAQWRGFEAFVTRNN